MEKFKVIPNFVNAQEIEFVKTFTDDVLATNRIIVDQPDTKRPLIRFGKDFNDGDNANEDFSVLPAEEKEFFTNFANKVISTVKNVFNYQSDLWLTNLWVARQYPGAEIALHDDTDDGINDHYIYSAVLYLNTLPDEDGTIFFDEMNFSHWPQAGDLLVFDTQNTGQHRVPPIKDYRYTIPMVLTKDPKFKLNV
jgi:hypothetical protein